MTKQQRMKAELKVVRSLKYWEDADFFDLKVKINEYQKAFRIDSIIIKNFIRKFESLIIEKTILN